MKEYYNIHHQLKFFNIGDIVNLRLYKGYQISAITSKKIDSQLIDSLRIFERINRLVYRLDLSKNIRIYDIVFITHLKPATYSFEDSYKRRRSPPSAVIVDNKKKYQVKRLIRKRRIRRGRE